jgi:hypothetical protein
MTDRFPGRPKPGTLRLVHIDVHGHASSRFILDSEFVWRRYEELKTEAATFYCAIFVAGRSRPLTEWHSEVTMPHRKMPRND